MKRLSLMRISKFMMTISLIISVMFAGFTIYGDKVGNFVINLGSSSDVNLSLCIDENRLEHVTYLSFPGLDRQGAATYNMIPKDVTNGIGSKNDNQYQRYMGFSFYLCNLSEVEASYDIILKITERGPINPDSILRVMMVEGDSEPLIFAKSEENEQDKAYLEQHINYTAIPFQFESEAGDNQTIFKFTRTEFMPEDYIKYTFVLWFEGWDVECTDDMIGGRLKLSLEFNGY